MSVTAQSVQATTTCTAIAPAPKVPIAIAQASIVAAIVAYGVRRGEFSLLFECRHTVRVTMSLKGN